MDSNIQQVFSSYPAKATERLLEVRDLILDTASSCEAGQVTETLKWNEPSYATKTGSPVRLGWKAKKPDNYFLYFHCQTRLVETFAELYGNALVFDGTRAIVLQLDGKLPKRKIEHCLSLALRYHELKHLPLLGA